MCLIESFIVTRDSEMSSNYGQELKVDSKETLEQCKAFYSSIGFKLLQTTESCLMLQRYEASAEGGGFTLRLELGKTTSAAAAAVYTSDKLSVPLLPKPTPKYSHSLRRFIKN